MSRSMVISSILLNSSTSGRGRETRIGALSASALPNRSNCPSIFFLPDALTLSKTRSRTCSSARRFAPSESKAPARIRLSMARRFRSCPYILRQKSSNEEKLPFLARSDSTACTNPRPTFLTAAIPKRRLPCSATVKSASDSFTSGGNSAIPISRHSAMYSATLVLSCNTLVKRAAIYSRG